MTNRKCPACEAVGRDKDGDHLFLMEDGVTWGCFKPYHAPYKEREDAEGEGQQVLYERESVEDIHHYPVVDFEYRGIRAEIYQKFSVRYAVETSTREPEFLYYHIHDTDGTLIGYHVRNLMPETNGLPRFLNVGEIKGYDKLLFGIKESGLVGKKCVITEGHQDMLAAYQMMLDKYPNYEPLAFSTNGGTGQIQDVTHSQGALSGLQEIILCFDNDEAGDKLTDQVAKLIGHKAKVMTFSEKDANDMLLSGKSREFISAFFNAKEHLPTDIVSGSSLMQEILEPIVADAEYPFDGLNRLTFGIFLSQIISIAAGVGTGKSVFVDAIVRYLVFTFGHRVGIFSLEEHPAYTMKKIVGGILKKPLHIPDVELDEAEIKGVIETIDDKIFLYNSQGYRDVSDIENTIRYMSSIGVKFFFVDPLTAVTADLSASEANEKLNSFCALLSSLVISLGITIFLVSHLNNPKTGKAHSEGGRVSGEQLTSSRAMYRWSHVVIGLERDQQAEEEEEKNRLTVRVIKNRLIGKTGTFDLLYDHDSYRLKEVVSEFD